MNNEIRIVIADDHPIVRRGLRESIEEAEGLIVLGEAGDGKSALELIRKQKPDVAVLDISMPGINGFAVAREIVNKESSMGEIVNCIKAVAEGKHYTSPALTSYLVSRSRRTESQEKAGLKALTPTERRILKLIAQYKTSREIADELFISYNTVETHRRNICEKLDLHGSHALMKFALAHDSELS